MVCNLFLDIIVIQNQFFFCQMRHPVITSQLDLPRFHRSVVDATSVLPQVRFCREYSPIIVIGFERLIQFFPNYQNMDDTYIC